MQGDYRMEGRRRSRMWAIASLLLMPVVAGVGWLGGRASLDTREASASARPDVTAPSGSPSDAGRSSLGHQSITQRPADAPLPDLNLPLRDTLQGLRQRADAGEAAAACRLAAEMEYCDTIRQRLDAASAMLRSPQALGVPIGQQNAEAQARVQAFKRAVAERSDRLLQQSTHCEGVQAFGPDQRVRYWRAAAMGGSVAALRHYAVGNAFRNNETLDNLEALRVYRQEAEAMASRAVAAGDLPTTLALASAYSPLWADGRHLLLDQALPTDAARALSLYLHVKAGLRGEKLSAPVQAALDSAIRELEIGLDGEALARAHAQAAAYQRGTPAFRADQGAVFSGFVRGRTADVMREECAPP